MNALIIHENGFDFRQAPDKRPGNGEVKIKLKTAGLNHRDLFLMKNHKTGNHEFTLGSDGHETGLDNKRPLRSAPACLLHQPQLKSPGSNVPNLRNQ